MVWGYIKQVQTYLNQVRSYQGKKRFVFSKKQKTMAILNVLVTSRMRPGRVFVPDSLLLTGQLGKNRFCSTFQHLSPQARECEVSGLETATSLRSLLNRGLPLCHFSNGTDSLLVGSRLALKDWLMRIIHCRQIVVLSAGVFNMVRKTRYWGPFSRFSSTSLGLNAVLYGLCLNFQNGVRVVQVGFLRILAFVVIKSRS